MFTADELRGKYLDFFKEKGHAIIPSAQIVPENDPTTLFITAGMHPLVPYLMGEKHPEGTRLANTQKCIRTIDIDEVGDTTHHTFFEMLGNWSLGDYFKKEAISWSWEFLTDDKWLGLDKNRIAVSVFEGENAGKDNEIPFDEDAYGIWENIFKENNLPTKRIAKLGREENWWGPAGKTGPCGPDSEMFYWVGNPAQVPDSFNDDNDLWVEIWNDVFMEYHKNEKGEYAKMEKQNVDTGLGFIRVLAALNDLDDNYKTSLFVPIIERIEELSGMKYGEKSDAKHLEEDGQCWIDTRKSMRIIADHINAAVFMLADGVAPANTDRGYILRRLIRRAVRQGHLLGIKEGFVVEVAKIVQNIYGAVFPEVLAEKILTELEKEEKRFRGTLERGLMILDKLYPAESQGLELSKTNGVPAKYVEPESVFDLFQTHGFPFEMIKEELGKRGLDADKSEFENRLKKHQELSRTASVGMFKGGLADTGEATRQLHTVAHLMLAGLRKTLGDHVHQKGSNINGERVRFDFSHPEKMTAEEKTAVENYVNEVIESKTPVVMEELTLADAKMKGAEGAFENKYGEMVKVFTVGSYSNEICGGPHVENTGDIKGKFKIKKEQSSSSGVRRIKGILI